MSFSINLWCKSGERKLKFILQQKTKTMTHILKAKRSALTKSAKKAHKSRRQNFARKNAKVIKILCLERISITSISYHRLLKKSFLSQDCTWWLYYVCFKDHWLIWPPHWMGGHWSQKLLSAWWSLGNGCAEGLERNTILSGVWYMVHKRQSNKNGSSF